MEVKSMSFIKLAEKKPGSALGCVALHKLFGALNFLLCKRVIIIITTDLVLLQRENDFLLIKYLE